MQKRTLGKDGLVVSALGLGCMGMSYAYGPADEKESLRVLDRAKELGITFFDTAEVYGPYANEDLLGRWLKNKNRAEVVIATKFGFTWGADGRPNGVDSKPAHIRQSVEGSLKRLGTDYIDLYYQHRLDRETPIEETVGALKELVQAGKIRHIGLSEVGPDTIRRAHKTHPVTALQSEYSLWDRGVEEKILPTLRELEIGFVPFSPLGRGFLSGKMTSLSTLDQNDFRQSLPRFQDENVEHNLQLVTFLQKLAERYAVTPAQIALAWLLRCGNDIVPIPGTKRVNYLEENVKATDVALAESVWTQLDAFLLSFQSKGQRYPESVLKMIDNQ